MEFRTALLTSKSDMSDSELRTRADGLGLDPRTFRACLASTETIRAVEESVQQGTRLGVVATPTFFINGRKVEGARGAEVFEEIIDEELKLSASTKQEGQ